MVPITSKVNFNSDLFDEMITSAAIKIIQTNDRILGIPAKRSILAKSLRQSPARLARQVEDYRTGLTPLNGYISGEL